MKNDFRSYFLVLILCLLFFFLQTSILNPVPFIHIPINFLVVLSICFAGFASISQRVVISLYCGLLIDFWFSSCSFYTLSLLIVNSLVSFISLRTQLDNIFIFVSVALGTLFVELINASFLGFCLYSTPFNPLVIYQHSILKLLIGNTFFALIIFPYIKRKFMIKTGFGRY